MINKSDECGCKIGRVTTKYGLPKADSRLVEDWHRGMSVRSLTDELNKDLVASELNAANVGHVKWSKTPVYEALHTDGVSDAEAIEIKRELERAGVEIEQLSADMVSHQTVYRHLTECLDASKDNDPSLEERREKARDTVYALQQRTEAVTKSTIKTLQSADATYLGDVKVLANLQVVCGDCERSMDFETAISEGCDCSSS